MTHTGAIVARHAWVGPALVVWAALQLLLCIAVFAAVPLASMPMYLVQGYLVLDAT